MIGLDITFPKEGIAPGVQETADAVAHLIELGYADQLVLSHDVFLKQMWAKNGGNGWGFVPDVFLAYWRSAASIKRSSKNSVSIIPDDY